jgi:hypothetical protein
VLRMIDDGGDPRRLPVLSLSAVSSTMGHWYARPRGGAHSFICGIGAGVGQLEIPSAEGSEVGLVRGNGGEVVTVKHADSRDGQLGTDA